MECQAGQRKTFPTEGKRPVATGATFQNRQVTARMPARRGTGGLGDPGGGQLCAPHHTHQPERTRRLSGLGQHGLEEGWEGPEEGG